MRIAVVVDTRPEAIKRGPITRLLDREALIIHTGQHFSPGMSGHIRPPRLPRTRWRPGRSPQPVARTPPSPNPKDKVENDLRRAVCDHRVTLTDAQTAIATDWTTAEHASA